MICRVATFFLLAACCVSLAGCPTAGVTAAGEPAVETAASLPGAVRSAETVPAGALSKVRYLILDAPPGMSQAVVVQGFPLVHTRQLLPLDGQGRLVGEGSAERQIAQVLTNLHMVLDAAGSSLHRLVRLNVYAASPQIADLLRYRLAQRTRGAARPAITPVVSPLAHPQAMVAVDAVATVTWARLREAGAGVAIKRFESTAGDKECADVAMMPPGGVVYLSGQPDKSPRSEATANSLTALLEIVDQLKLDRSHVVQLKVFVDSAAAADEVLAEVKRFFPDQLTPPVVFVEWIASAPIEIEMIVHRPLTGEKPARAVRYYTPPGVEPSPTFSRVAIVEADHQIYISGLSARAPGDGEAQVRDVFARLKRILFETGSDLGHLVKATYYVSDKDASDMLNKLRPEYYDPERPPAASKVTVHGAGHPDRTLTMDMIAVGSG